MSRLQAPGFSKLRPPGFTRAPVTPHIPQVSSENSKETVFKRPEDVNTTQANDTKLLQPRSQLPSKMRMPGKPSHLQSASTTTQHGPSPYDRAKPVGNQIPYVGKKRVTGTLKAPESRLLKQSFGSQKAKNTPSSTTMTMPPPTAAVDSVKFQAPQSVIPAPSVKIESKSQSSVSTAVQSMPATSKRVEAKPVKRQLIPDLKPQSKLGRPKSYTGISEHSSGLQAPGKYSSGRSGSVDGTSQGSLSSRQGLSRSLQTLPQGAKPRGLKKPSLSNKSASEENLLANTRSVKEQRKSISNVNVANNVGKPRQSRYSVSNARQRASTHNSPLNTTVNISTPLALISDKKHLKSLKISPIPNNNQDPDATFEICASKAPTNLINETRIVENDKLGEDDSSIFETLNVPTLNMTYSTNDGIKNNESMSSFGELHTSGHKTSIIDEAGSHHEDQVFSEEHYVEKNMLDQTRVLHPLNKDLGETQILTSSDPIDNFINESDFIENETMPKHLSDDTPCKSGFNESCFDNQNESFSEDILKVIEAISSKAQTSSSSVITMSVSPMKQHDLSSQYNVQTAVSANHDIDSTTNLHQSDKSKEIQKGPSGLEFCDDYFAADENANLTEGSATITDPQSVSHNISQPVQIPVVRPRSPQTPQQADEFSINISARCNSVSMGVLSRASKDSRFGKILRRNTFGSQDMISKFRIPKEMHITETFDGHIVMDNATFLHFSNDVKSLKTQLLKLRRALLETDCPSPLMKTPLKRSNSTGVNRGDLSSTPPLSPRLAVPSPMAVVDPLVMTERNTCHSLKEKKEIPENTEDNLSAITAKFQNALTTIEELEKDLEVKKSTIHLLTSKIEHKEETEIEMQEENVILREEVAQLRERLQKFTGGSVHDVDDGELFSSGSFKDDFEYTSLTSRKDVLTRLYSQ